MKKLDDMSGPEALEFMRNFMERGEVIMTKDHTSPEFVRGFKVAVLGFNAGLKMIDGSSVGEAFVGMLPGLLDTYAKA